MIQNNFDLLYKDILLSLNNKKYTYNARTRIKVKEMFGAAFVWDMNFLPISNIRRTYSHIAASELAWSLSGERDLKWISKYTKIWDKFAIKGKIDTAYGYRWKTAFGINQITNIIAKLKKDPSSRQQILCTWDARVDNVKKAMNIPCPFAVVVGIVEGKLNLHLSVRSNDVICGLPYDLYFYTLLGSMFAKELKVKKGILFYSIANYHVYQNHEDIVNKILELPTKQITYPNDFSWNYKQILKNKEKFVENFKETDRRVNTEWQFSEVAKINL